MTSDDSGSSGRVCYLQIPALDKTSSAEFYERVFGWRIERPYPDFEAPGLIGQWVDDRPVSREGGVVFWLSTESIDATLSQVAAAGGEVIDGPAADGPSRLLATIRDPAGNVVGLAQHGPHGRA
jgi:uncharacterized protein